jgi:hypothetical protein
MKKVSLVTVLITMLTFGLCSIIVSCIKRESDLNEKPYKIQSGMLVFKDNQSKIDFINSYSGVSVEKISNRLKQEGHTSYYEISNDIFSMINEIDKKEDYNLLANYISDQKVNILHTDSMNYRIVNGIYAAICNKSRMFQIDNLIYYMDQNFTYCIEKEKQNLLEVFIKNGILSAEIKKASHSHSNVQNIQALKNTRSATAIKPTNGGAAVISPSTGDYTSSCNNCSTGICGGKTIQKARTKFDGRLNYWINPNSSNGPRAEFTNDLEATNYRRARTSCIWGNWININDEDLTVNGNCSIYEFNTQAFINYTGNQTALSSYDISLQIGPLAFANLPSGMSLTPPAQDVYNLLQNGYSSNLSGSGYSYFNGTYCCTNNYISFNF